MSDTTAHGIDAYPPPPLPHLVPERHKEPSSSLPTPPTTTTSPPASLSLSHDDVPPPSTLSFEQQLPPTVEATSLPPPPSQVTPAFPSLPATLMHTDSSSSVAVQPPTPASQLPPPAIAPPQFTPEPQPLPPALHPEPVQQEQQPQQQQLPFADQAEEPVPYTNGFHHGEATPVDVPFGAHPGLGSLPHPDAQSGVDVLGEVAMEEAALGLANFAAGAGSGDVRGGSPALPAGETVEYAFASHEQPSHSPSLKRTADEAAAGEHGASEFEAATSNGALNGSAYGAYGSMVNGLGGVAEVGDDEREAKRLRVEAEPSPVLPQSSPVDSFNPYSLAAPSVVQPSPPSSAPASLPPTLASPLPAASPTPSAPAVQGYDPSAFTIAPTLASSAPPYPPPSQPIAPPPTTMPTSDLHNLSNNAFHAASPHIAPPSAISNTASPVPPTPSESATPLYAPPNFFDQQPQASTSTGLPQQHHQYPSLPPHQFQHQPSPQLQQQPQQHYGVVKQEDGQGSPHSYGGSPDAPALGGGIDPSAPGSLAGASLPPVPAGPPPPPPIHVLTKDQQKFCINMIRNLKRNKNAPPFLKPVDPVALLIPDYPKVILHPMDLGTIEARLQATGKAMASLSKVNRIYGLDYSLGREGALWEGQVPKGAVDAGDPETYRTVDEFKEDLDRVWDNCFKYNGGREKNPVSAMAGIMMDAANKSFNACPFAPMVSPYPPPPEPKRDPHRGNQPFVPNIRHSSESSRPKREIHAPVKDLAYLESAGLDPTAGGIYNLSGLQGMGGGGMGGMMGMQQPKPRKNNGVKAAQEQLRFCKEVVRELFKKVHEAYAYPFYQPVDLNAYPTYAQYVKRPMDLSTIRTRLEHNQYPTPPYAAFENDVRTIFKNCYAFNPPGTAVNDWGHRLEAVFEHKWDERPLMFDDDSGDEDPAFSAMEQQLQLMQANLEMMKATKKAEKEQKRYQQMQQRLSAPKPAKKPAAPQPNPYAMSAYASAPPPMPRHTSGGGPKKHSSRPGGGGGGGATHKKKKKRHDDDSDDYYDDDDGGAYYGGSTSTTSRRKAAAPVQQYEEFVDFEMKRELAVKIVAFQDDQLQEAINIIRRGRPELLGAADQEIELDIDQLDQFTLLNLYRYVCPDSKPAVRPITAPARATADKAPKNGGGAGGLNKNQRKNLDEEKEAERIEMLEARLREFESTGASGETPGAYDGEDASRRGSEGGLPSAVATGGDGDQASSDSSDGDSSDSDSDED